MTDFEARRQEFWIQMVSTQETNYLMAEVWYQNFLIATVDKEMGSPRISFAGGRKANHEYESISVSFSRLLETLEEAKQALYHQ